MHTPRTETDRVRTPTPPASTHTHVNSKHAHTHNAARTRNDSRPCDEAASRQAGRQAQGRGAGRQRTAEAGHVLKFGLAKRTCTQLHECWHGPHARIPPGRAPGRGRGFRRQRVTVTRRCGRRWRASRCRRGPLLLPQPRCRLLQIRIVHFGVISRVDTPTPCSQNFPPVGPGDPCVPWATMKRTTLR